MSFWQGVLDIYLNIGGFMLMVIIVIGGGSVILVFAGEILGGALDGIGRAFSVFMPRRRRR